MANVDSWLALCNRVAAMSLSAANTAARGVASSLPGVLLKNAQSKVASRPPRSDLESIHQGEGAKPMPGVVTDTAAIAAVRGHLTVGGAA